MASTALRSEERIGLGVAIAFHVGLVALLLWRPPLGDVTIPPDRIEVTLSDDVALKSTSPEPMADARPDVAPELGQFSPPEPEAAPPEPETPPPPPREVEPKPAPRPVAKPRPRPQPKAEPQPKPKPKPKPRPAAKAEKKPPAKAEPKPSPPKKVEKAGGSRVGADFLEGVAGGRSSGKSRNPPAEAAGPQVQSSLLGAISREIKPHWQGKVPEGADSEKLVTILRWNLNRDGSLAGAPQVVRQEGITDANRPQAKRHAEQAVRAVQLAAPFDLPDQYYDTWKRVTIRFDKRLSQ